MRTIKYSESVWIAVSAKGYPAPFIGYAFKRRELNEAYEQRFNHSLTDGGYRVAKARLIMFEDESSEAD